MKHLETILLKLPPKNIHSILWLNDSTLLLLHEAQDYSVVALLSSRLMAEGALPALAHSLTRLSAEEVVYILLNELYIFNVFTQQVTHRYFLASYNLFDKFDCFVDTYSPGLILFQRTTPVSSVEASLSYEVHILQVEGRELVLLKKHRSEKRMFLRFAVFANEMFSYSISGYQIQVCFVESRLKQSISSIYSLLLRRMAVGKDCVELQFTHDSLDKQAIEYKVTRTSLQRRVVEEEISYHRVASPNGRRALQICNIYNLPQKQREVAVQITLEQDTLYLHFIEEYSHRLKQAVLLLLR